MPDGYKVDQMAIKYTNIFHRKPLQKKLPRLVFLVRKQTIWQPRSTDVFFFGGGALRFDVEFKVAQ
jgi:hypothetical protein